MSSYEREQEHHPKSGRTSRRGRRALVAASLTFATAALGLVAPGSASATAQAWECSSGSVCIYTGAYGTGSRCSWSNADADWYSGDVQCSWSDTQNVGSVYNRGTSSSYNWVILYTGANYGGTGYCVAQDGGSWSNLNVRLRSHRWRASCS
ncbi:peptidase inhibitor family I36 protein [Streptomyces sp. NBC_01451]|uniref:peptidase inhibitor family I36 protein n=1 Tax=Streptomyces sp. NBC_01451 TaxID=2903872 RepID=UPI002E34CC6C|nr:peptidase inhibitor family I36 protein [Streptomyces sp. NBC_01451]